MLRSMLFLMLSSAVFSKDLSLLYQKELKRTQLSEVRELQKYKVILVPGVLAQSFISSSNNPIKLNLLFEDAFKEQMTLLQKLKVDYEFVLLETENSPAKNALVIIEAIKRSDKPVLIYSHSKGGIDTLEAIRQDPEILHRIHGWVSIQTPFWGAPVASELSDFPVTKNSGEELFKWMGGDAGGMSSLTIKERVEYMNLPDVKNLLNKIQQSTKFINFASYKTNTFGIDTPLELFRNYTDLKAGANDGVVPLDSALMKSHGTDCDFIIEAEVDHLMTMTRYYLNNTKYNQKAHTLSILKLLL
jgi:triacylglycerol lipase